MRWKYNPIYIDPDVPEHQSHVAEAISYYENRLWEKDCKIASLNQEVNKLEDKLIDRKPSEIARRRRRRLRGLPTQWRQLRRDYGLLRPRRTSNCY